MRRSAALACGAALCAAFAPLASPADLPEASDALTPAQIVARYDAALAREKKPKAMSFDYSLEQLGLRNMEQTHHVYRSALDERDETRIVDGYVLPRPTVRIIANRLYRYDLHAVAPTTAVYKLAYAGARLDGDDVTYVFRVMPAAPRSFVVDRMELDGKTFLPKTLHFTISNGTAHGSGQFNYTRAESYWVVTDVRVAVHLPGGATARENIKWSNYQFPSSLPASTFIPPHVILAPEPEATPTATPLVLPGAP